MIYNPENDGIDHINVYSKGKTRLGRLLSNFAYSPIDLPDGKFNSIEGYWYWLLCNHPQRDELRKLWGFNAKKRGRELRSFDWPVDNETEFREKITLAIKTKINNNNDLKNLLKDSTLPLTHYYVYGSKNVNVPQADWLLDIITNFRQQLKI